MAIADEYEQDLNTLLDALWEASRLAGLCGMNELVHPLIAQVKDRIKLLHPPNNYRPLMYRDRERVEPSKERHG